MQEPWVSWRYCFPGKAEPYGYSYANKKHYEDRVQYRLIDDEAADDAARIALRVWKALGCRDAGRVDCRCGTDGQVNFMEINPIPGLHPVHSDLVILTRMLSIPYDQLVEWILASASERVVPPRIGHTAGRSS